MHGHVHSDTEIWIDGGHNSHAAIAIADAMGALDKKGLILIIGMLNTKNCRKFLEPFKNITDAVIAIKIPDNINSHKPEKIVHDAQSLGISAVAEIDLHSALAYTRKYLNDSKRILICGSLYLAGYAIKIHRG